LCVSPEIQVRQLLVSKMAVTVSILSPLLLGTLIRRREFKDIQTFLSFLSFFSSMPSGAFGLVSSVASSSLGKLATLLGTTARLRMTTGLLRS